MVLWIYIIVYFFVLDNLISGTENKFLEIRHSIFLSDTRYRLEFSRYHKLVVLRFCLD